MQDRARQRRIRSTGMDLRLVVVRGEQMNTPDDRARQIRSSCDIVYYRSAMYIQRLCIMLT